MQYFLADFTDLCSLKLSAVHMNLAIAGEALDQKRFALEILDTNPHPIFSLSFVCIGVVEYILDILFCRAVVLMK